MSKVVYRDKQRSVFLSHVETILLFAAEFGGELLDAFFPARYPETWWTRRLFGLDGVRPSNVRVAKYRLTQRGLVTNQRDGSYRITPRGRSLAAKVMKLLASKSRPAVWDRKWRVLAFDVPEIHKNHRDGLRRVLTGAGYVRLQNSVWIGKHPLPDDAFEFIAACDLDRHIVLFLANSVDKDERINRLFRDRFRT